MDSVSEISPEDRSHTVSTDLHPTARERVRSDGIAKNPAALDNADAANGRPGVPEPSENGKNKPS